MASTKEKISNVQRSEFVKQLEYFYEMSHPNWRKVLSFAFLKGIATGFGVFLGGTLLIALLLWILSLFGNVPLLNEIADTARKTLDTTN